MQRGFSPLLPRLLLLLLNAGASQPPLTSTDTFTAPAGQSGTREGRITAEQSQDDLQRSAADGVGARSPTPPTPARAHQKLAS